MDEIEKVLKLYELEQTSYITPNRLNNSLPLRKEVKESDVQPSGSVPLNKHPNDTKWCRITCEVVPPLHFSIKW